MKFLTFTLLIFTILFCGNLFAEKSFQQQAQEAGTKGDTAFKSKNFAVAGENYENAISLLHSATQKDGIPLDQDRIKTWNANAYSAFYNAQNWDKFFLFAEKVLEEKPNDWETIKAVATVYWQVKKNVDQAVAYLIEKESKKQSIKIRNMIAFIHNKSENWEEAIVWYKKMLELQKSSKTLEKLGNTYLKVGKNKEAIKVIKDYIATKPKKSELKKSYRNLVSIFTKDVVDYREAVVYAKKYTAIDFRPNNSGDIGIAQSVITINFSKLNNYKEAEEYCDFILKHKKNDKVSNYYKAEINYARATESWEKNREEGKKLYQTAKKYYLAVEKTPKYGASASKKIKFITDRLK